MFISLMAFLAEYFYLVVLGMAIAFLAGYFYLHRGDPGQRRRFIEMAAAAICIGVLAFLLAQLGTHVIDDPRPFLAGSARRRGELQVLTIPGAA